jgi:hypothetical protein
MLCSSQQAVNNLGSYFAFGPALLLRLSERTFSFFRVPRADYRALHKLIEFHPNVPAHRSLLEVSSRQMAPFREPLDCDDYFTEFDSDDLLGWGEQTLLPCASTHPLAIFP